MIRRLLLLVLACVVAIPAAGATSTAPDRLVIPYLSGGAGVYLDDDGRPVTSEGAPQTPGIHVRPQAPQPEPAPTPAPRLPPVVPVVPPPQPEPSPAPSPAPTPAPSPPAGYERPDLVAGVALPNVTSVFCRADASWPTESSLANATGYWVWGGNRINMRTWRCDGIAQEKIGTEAFARGLFVLAHEAAHAAGFGYECDADIQGLKTMGAISARLGWGSTVGEDAARWINDFFRPNPPPEPYCVGRVPYPWP